MNGGRIAVFLDRDGTLNEEVDFLRTPQELRMIPGAAAAIRTLNTRDIITCVISNQSGIARGFYSEADVDLVHAAMTREILREGAHIDRYYFCPHHPTEGLPPYNIVCDCRKPSPGMLEQGEREFGIDLGRSFVVGDRIVDVQAGKAVGASTILVLTGYGRTSLAESAQEHVVADHVAPSVVEAVEFIIEHVEPKKVTNG